MLAATWFVAYSAVLPLTQAQWGLSGKQAGLIQSGFHLGYLTSLFIVGFIADHFGAKRAYIATGVAAATGTTKGTISVTWTAGTDAGSGVKGYTIHYVQATTCPAPAPASYPLTTSLVSGAGATLSGLATGKKYCLYAVTSDNAGNPSAPSAVASAKAR